MPNINWSFVAGFFDGEGCIVAKRDGTISFDVSMAQTSTCVLEEIKEFLRTCGIKSYIYSVDPEKYTNNLRARHRKILHSLRLNERESVRRFVAGVLPYVVVKRAFVQDVRRFMLMYPAINKILCREQQIILTKNRVRVTHCSKGHCYDRQYKRPGGTQPYCSICTNERQKIRKRKIRAESRYRATNGTST